MESNNSKKTDVFCCRICCADTKGECICDRITGYYRDTGVPIVDITDDEANYLSSKEGE